MEVVRLYEFTYKALEPYAKDLERQGLTDSPLYRDYEVYRQGYEHALQEVA